MHNNFFLNCCWCCSLLVGCCSCCCAAVADSCSFVVLFLVLHQASTLNRMLATSGKASCYQYYISRQARTSSQCVAAGRQGSGWWSYQCSAWYYCIDSALLQWSQLAVVLLLYSYARPQHHLPLPCLRTGSSALPSYHSEPWTDRAGAYSWYAGCLHTVRMIIQALIPSRTERVLCVTVVTVTANIRSTVITSNKYCTTVQTPPQMLSCLFPTPRSPWFPHHTLLVRTPKIPDTIIRSPPYN